MYFVKNPKFIMYFIPFIKEAEHPISDTSPLDDRKSHDLPEGSSQDLYEALQRERKLKSRVQELVIALEKLSRNSEIRHQQSAEFVSDLKKANRSAQIFDCS